jgi:hypothetical protein
LIKNCRETIEGFKNKGLQTKEELEAEIKRDGGTKETNRLLKEMQDAGSDQPLLNREYIYRHHYSLEQLEENIQHLKEMIDKLNKR